MAQRCDHRTPGSTFVGSQRPRAGSRLSSFIHGYSVMGKKQKPHPTGLREPAQPQAHPSCHDQEGLYCLSPEPRSRTSTLSIIDPIHSPNHGTGPLPPGTLEYHSNPHNNGHNHPSVTSTAYSNEFHFPQAKSKRRHHPSRHRKPSKRTRTRFPHIADSRVRHKFIGTLLSGTLLTLVLITYLALAISNVCPTATFHAVFIFFILVLTIIFSHFLIRLCMLAYHPVPRFGCSSRTRRFGDPEANPRRPIRVITSHDEEADFAHDNSSIDTEKELPVPLPPAYGRWRGSVRVDPELLDWQRVENPELERATRELVRVGDGCGPPSYTSRELVLAPAPLLISRRELEGRRGGFF